MHFVVVAPLFSISSGTIAYLTGILVDASALVVNEMLELVDLWPILL